MISLKKYKILVKQTRSVHTNEYNRLLQLATVAIASEQDVDRVERQQLNFVNEVVNGDYPSRTSLLPVGYYAEDDVKLHCFYEWVGAYKFVYRARCTFNDEGLQDTANVTSPFHVDPEVSGITYRFIAGRREGVLHVGTSQLIGEGCVLLPHDLSYELFPKIVRVIKNTGLVFNSQRFQTILPAIRSFVLDENLPIDSKTDNLMSSIAENFTFTSLNHEKISIAVQAIVGSIRSYEDLHISGFYIGFSVLFYLNPELLASYIEMKNLFNLEALPYATVLRPVYAAIGTRWGHLFFQRPGAYISPFGFVVPTILSRAIRFVKQLNSNEV